MPAGLAESQYPADAAIRAALTAYAVVEVDALRIAQALGDAAGRSANVVMLGMLSTLEPFRGFPEALRLGAAPGQPQAGGLVGQCRGLPGRAGAGGRGSRAGAGDSLAR